MNMKCKVHHKPLPSLAADDTSAKETISRKNNGSQGRYSARKAKQQTHFNIGDLVMLDAKNICTKHPSKKLARKLYAACKMVEQ